MQHRVKPAVDLLVARARQQGMLRADVVPLDIPMIQLMVAAVTDNTGNADLWRRYLRLLLDGMRASPDTSPLPAIHIDDAGLMNALDAASTRQANDHTAE